ncbi:MAG: A/G-specific adenine glycosylase [gamma proteobacterium symbiont of Bathyaustriella thionipta]|nr:A/G-specific adenine glycosylase [gamma proteobacterium symbiont of Bathyaustriella thionipta]
MIADDFARRVLRWQADKGRHDLPWQNPPSAYRVWVSEIMLQQTRVATVIPYFQRFIQRFAEIQDLYHAERDEVLHHWSGLGYYARARNLHRAAAQICQQYSGQIPADMGSLQALPGIGRSTAAAILSLSGGQSQPILDGNVKRVLCRHAGIKGWPGKSAVLKQLWQLSEQLTPLQNTAGYNQGMMDLGAMICTRSRPACDQCPLAAECVANHLGQQQQLPESKPKSNKPSRQEWVLITVKNGQVLLKQRPPSGVWGGLWHFPAYSSEPEALASLPDQAKQSKAMVLPSRRHSFSHFHLHIHPLLVEYNEKTNACMEDGCSLWYNIEQPQKLGLAAPVSRLLQEVQQILETNT